MAQKHCIAVHGATHGAWVFHKVKARVEASGHLFTAVDLAASGISEKKLDEIHTFYEYTKPLLEVLASIPENEKVILLGHSGGGMSIALAMEKYPNKISVAVFLNAIMPDSTNPPCFVLDKYLERTPAESWLDVQFSSYGNVEEPIMSMSFGPKFLSQQLYQQSSIEDLELAKALTRPASLFMEDLKKAGKLFSNEGYGSVKRVYIVCCQDNAITEEFQRWMIENNPVAEVKEIKTADHMSMISEPQLVCAHLLDILNKCA